MTAEELAAIKVIVDLARSAHTKNEMDYALVRAVDAVEALIAEVERLQENFLRLDCRMEGIHNRMASLGYPCGSFCQGYLAANLEEFRHRTGACVCHKRGLPLHACEFIMREMFPEKFACEQSES